MKFLPLAGVGNPSLRCGRKIWTFEAFTQTHHWSLRVRGARRGPTEAKGFTRQLHTWPGCPLGKLPEQTAVSSGLLAVLKQR